MVSENNLARLKLLEPARRAIGGQEERVVLPVLDSDDVAIIGDVLVASTDHAVTISVLEHLQAETDALFLWHLTLPGNQYGILEVVDTLLDVHAKLGLASIAVVLDLDRVARLELARDRCAALVICGNRLRNVTLGKGDRTPNCGLVALAHVGGEVTVLHEDDREVHELTRSRGGLGRPCNVNSHRVLLVCHV